MSSPLVIITGATGALGGEIARALSRDGFSVLALYRENAAAARRLQRETNCRAVRCDVTAEDEVEAAFTAAMEYSAATRDAKLHAVIHTAGIARDALLARQTRDDWNATLRINADGAFLVTRAALRHLPRGGRLILFTSRAGEHGNRGQAAYAASKAAVEALMRCAAREGGEHGIAVNALCPGFTPSAMTARLGAESAARFRRESVLQQGSTPQGVAAAVRWLLSDAAREVSGQIVPCHSRL